jgi:PIN domain nuclease of toxin-antitoxin system
VTRLLLDTHTLLWWVFEQPELSAKAEGLIMDRGNEIVVSVVSPWEIVIKARLGRLDVPEDVPAFMREQLDRNGFTVLPVSLDHVLRVNGLPPLHKDPFDRLLVAQALHEAMPLVTRDGRLAAYGAETLW